MDETARADHRALVKLRVALGDVAADSIARNESQELFIRRLELLKAEIERVIRDASGDDA